MFRANLIGHNVKCVETVREVCTYLEAEDWDALFLDHDLGGEIMCASGENTGYEVACWLAAHSDRKPKYIFLHSLNPTGRKNMKFVLPEAVEYPFAWKDPKARLPQEKNDATKM
jgi:hypothetical protein